MPNSKIPAAFFGYAEMVLRGALPVFYKVIVAEGVFAIAYWYVMADGLKDFSGTPLGADFINVYAAGLMTLQGRPAEVYDWQLHGQVEQAISGYPSLYFAWHYPPMFLAVAMLAALGPYLWAFAFYMGGTFIGYCAVMRRLASSSKGALWMLIAFPGVYTNVTNGQNGFVTAGLLGAGVLFLEKRPWLAGIFFGLLAYKPQFFIVVPFLLVFGGYGRAFGAAVLTAFLSAVLSWAAFGTETWLAFFQSTELTQHIILEQGSTGWKKIQSVFSWVRMWGGGIETAYAIQALAGVVSLACAAWIWRRRASLPVRTAALCAAMLLTTPYFLDYDLVILAVPLALLARQGAEEGYYPFEKFLLVAIWMLPLVARLWGGHLVPLTPPLMAALLGLCLAWAQGCGMASYFGSGATKR